MPLTVQVTETMFPDATLIETILRETIHILREIIRILIETSHTLAETIHTLIKMKHTLRMGLITT